MADAESNATSKRRRGRFHQVFKRVAFPLVALLLIGWEAQEAHVYQSESCELKTSAPSESALMKPLYVAVLRVTGLHGSPQVVSLGIDESLQFIQTNVCPARSFTADLVRTIAAQGPALIAIDKYYTQGVCSKDDSDADTTALLSAIDTVRMPVVVGASNHRVPGQDQHLELSCRRAAAVHAQGWRPSDITKRAHRPHAAQRKPAEDPAHLGHLLQ